MKLQHKSLLAALILFLAIPCFGVEYEPQRLATAIKYAEGNNPSWLYGIHHPDTLKPLGEAEARRRCLNTLKSIKTRYIASGAQGDYVDFASHIYCPYNSKVWAKNVKQLYAANKPLISAKGIK